MPTTQYIGSRYVPLLADPVEWSSTKEYEPLTIVTHEGNSYTSRQFVPKGIDIHNEAYWALTGNYNAQIELYRRETATAQNDINTLLPKSAFSESETVKDYIDNSNNSLDMELKNFVNASIKNEIITPEMFGAVGDGSTDDKSAFIAMFEYVNDVLNNVAYTYTAPIIYMKNVYNIGELNVPTHSYNALTFYGGVIIGSMTFGNIFQHLTFVCTSFICNNPNYMLKLEPVSTIEYKTILFHKCNFRTGNAVYINSRSLNIQFNACTFQSCDVAFYNNSSVDNVVFNNCWFDTKSPAKTENYTIYDEAKYESGMSFNECIIVNATTTALRHYFVKTKGIVRFNNTRVSNEGGSAFSLVNYPTDTPATIGGHRTACLISQCDINVSTNYGIISLSGFPTLISINNTFGQINGGKIIALENNTDVPYAVRPNMIIDMQGNAFVTNDRTLSANNNSSGISLTEGSLPSLPFELAYAMESHRSIDIEPIINSKIYRIELNTKTDIFKLHAHGTFYNTIRVNPVVFWVKYTTQQPNTNTWNSTIDLIVIAENAGEMFVQKTPILNGNDSVTYDVAAENGVYTISLTCTNRFLNSIDYGIVSNGFVSSILME